MVGFGAEREYSDTKLSPFNASSNVYELPDDTAPFPMIEATAIPPVGKGTSVLVEIELPLSAVPDEE